MDKRISGDVLNFFAILEILSPWRTTYLFSGAGSVGFSKLRFNFLCLEDDLAGLRALFVKPDTDMHRMAIIAKDITS